MTKLWGKTKYFTSLHLSLPKKMCSLCLRENCPRTSWTCRWLTLMSFFLLYAFKPLCKLPVCSLFPFSLLLFNSSYFFLLVKINKSANKQKTEESSSFWIVWNASMYVLALSISFLFPHAFSFGATLYIFLGLFFLSPTVSALHEAFYLFSGTPGKVFPVFPEKI